MGDLHSFGCGNAPYPGTPPQQVRLLWLFGIFLAVATATAWLLPESKPDAVLGRLDYGEFWWAVLLTAIALSGLGLALCPRPRRRLAAFRLGAVWLGTMLALLVVELLAWRLPVRHPMDNPYYFAAGGGFVASPDLPFERPAHLEWRGRSRGDLAVFHGDDDPYARMVTFRTDMDGFRNGQDLHRADLIMIGDSFAEAGNVAEEESFAALVGKELGMTVRNLGRAGYTTPTELIVLRKFGLKCRPKIVVWQIAESNDLAEVLDYQHWEAVGRPRYFDVVKRGRHARRKVWQRRSPTFATFAAVRTREQRPWYFTGNFQGVDGGQYPVRFLLSPGLQEPAKSHAGWPGFARALAEGAELCRAQNLRLLVVLIPMKYRVLGPYTQLAPHSAVLNRGFRGLPEEVALEAQLQPFCASNNIPFISATPLLKRKANGGELVYLPFDTHLSPSGHRAVAHLIVEQLRPAKHQPPTP